MANDCYGTMRVVAKDKSVLERIFKIMQNEDKEFTLAKNRGTTQMTPITQNGEFFSCDMDVDGAWDCSEFLYHDDDPKKLECISQIYVPEKNGYEYKYGTAHYTNLPHLAKTLGFGCEAFTTEPGCGFCEHWAVDHNGNFNYDEGAYSLEYPEGENGEPDYDAEPKEEIGLDNFMEFNEAGDIWVKPNF